MHCHLYGLNGPFNYFAGTVLRTVNILSLYKVQTPASTKGDSPLNFPSKSPWTDYAALFQQEEEGIVFR